MKQRSQLLFNLLLSIALGILSLMPSNPAYSQSLSETLLSGGNINKETLGTWLSFQKYSYGQSQYQQFFLSGPAKNKKLIILVHGGNFLSGSATDISMITLADLFLSKGYQVASINYRPLSVSRWPMPVEDIANAIQAIRLQADPSVKETTLVGFSAGAVAGALLLYSDQFEQTPQVDKFIGISGLYNREATNTAPLQAIQEQSLEKLDISKLIADISLPKSQTPALLIEGSQDYFADKYPGSSKSQASSLARTLEDNGIYSQVYWTTQPGFTDHIGPLGLIATGNQNIIDSLDSFLENSFK